MADNEGQSLEGLLRDLLPRLDAEYAKDGRPVPERPLAAARFVVDHLIVEVEGETKEGYLTRPWFAAIYQPVYKWYERRYGSGLTASRQAYTRGLVEYFGSLLAFRLPLVFTTPGKDDTLWVHFPKEALLEETPLEWFEVPPPLDHQPAARRAKLSKAIRKVATLLRGINVNLNTADLEEPKLRSLVSAVIRHFDKAAVDATTTEPVASSLAVWELQMACEKTMKCLLGQATSAYPETHDLRALHKQASGICDLSGAKKALGAFPSERRVLRWRYAEIPPPKPADFLRFYVAALDICWIYSARMRRKLVFGNFAVQIKRPPWHGNA